MWNTLTFWALVAFRVAGIAISVMFSVLDMGMSNMLVATYILVVVVDAVLGLVFTSDASKWIRISRMLLFAMYAVAAVWIDSWEPSLILVAEFSIYIGTEWWTRRKKGDAINTDMTVENTEENNAEKGSEESKKNLLSLIKQKIGIESHTKGSFHTAPHTECLPQINVM